MSVIFRRQQCEASIVIRHSSTKESLSILSRSVGNIVQHTLFLLMKINVEHFILQSELARLLLMASAEDSQNEENLYRFKVG